MFKKKSSNLDDIKLSEEQKANIKITLNQALKKYDFSPSPIDLELPIDNVNELDKAKDKNLIFLKNLVLKALENECPLKENEIIYSHFFHAGMDMDLDCSSTYLTYLTAGGCFYFQIYMSNKEIVIYGLDNYYKLIKSRKINISDIDSVGIYNKNLGGLKLSKENLILKIKPSTGPHLSNYYLIPSKKDNIIELTEFLDLLLLLGVPELSPPKKGIAAIIYFIFMAIFSLYVILYLMSSLYLFH